MVLGNVLRPPEIKIKKITETKSYYNITVLQTESTDRETTSVQ